MAAEKTIAIVLRVVPFSETSVVTTLFTRDFGKISALAKGARRPKSPFEAALDLLSICRIVFLRKTSDALHLLTEARLERRFRAGQRQLQRLYAGLYVVELLGALTLEGSSYPRLYDAAADALGSLDGDADIAATLVRFEWRLLDQLGLRPSLDACVNCGGLVDETARWGFSLPGGGLVCPRCRTGQRHVVQVSARARRLMRQLGDEPATRPDEPAPWGEVRALVDQYITYLLGWKPRLQPYLKQLGQETSRT
jgi:DNA repair protein RecO (recombination protein O)